MWHSQGHSQGQLRCEESLECSRIKLNSSSCDPASHRTLNLPVHIGNCFKCHNSPIHWATALEISRQVCIHHGDFTWINFIVGINTFAFLCSYFHWYFVLRIDTIIFYGGNSSIHFFWKCPRKSWSPRICYWGKTHTHRCTHLCSTYSSYWLQQTAFPPNYLFKLAQFLP